MCLDYGFGHLVPEFSAWSIEVSVINNAPLKYYMRFEAQQFSAQRPCSQNSPPCMRMGDSVSNSSIRGNLINSVDQVNMLNLVVHLRSYSSIVPIRNVHLENSGIRKLLLCTSCDGAGSSNKV